ncbi:MAG: hypothetical protein CL878_03650 [Dehalococcoidia bacterium]|nr:hypothetical protein [Dehalococcoidia bacterium]
MMREEGDAVLRKKIVARFPEGVLLDVEFQRHGEGRTGDLLEPGTLQVSLTLRGPDEYKDNPRQAPEQVCEQVIRTFLDTHLDAIRQLREELATIAVKHVSEHVTMLRFRYGRQSRTMDTGVPFWYRQGLVPTFASLTERHVELLDTLIAAGLATSRAEAARWCLARVPAQPAFKQLQKQGSDVKQFAEGIQAKQQATLDDEALRSLIRARFPKDSLLAIKLYRYGDHEYVEPGELSIVLVARGPEEHNTDYDKAPEKVGNQVVHSFYRTHEATIQQLHRDLLEQLAERVTHLMISYGGVSFSKRDGPPPSERKLRPISIPVGEADLQTLNTVIAAGAATNRDQAVRWSLDRIRERPAYEQLAEQVDELKQTAAKI